MDVDEAAERLYALPPEDFTAARDDLAKHADPEVRKAIKALRRPSAPAYVVNRLVRDRPDDIDSLIALGDEMRTVVSNGGDLRRLTEARRRAVADLVSAAPEAAGRDLTAAVEEDVAATLEAATADPQLRDAVRSGRLVKPLRYAGFGALPDLGDIVATAVEPSTRPPRRAAMRPATSPAAAGQPEAKDAKGPTPRTPPPDTKPPRRPTRARQAPPDPELAGLRARVRELAGAADDAERRYEAAVRTVEQAREALRDAEHDRGAAHTAASAARREAEKARRELARLERA